MIDRIDALEEKIAALVDKIRDLKHHISNLERQNRELFQIAEQKKTTDQDNVTLQSRISDLETELNGRDDKEATVKDRLKTILNRIDTLESEITELDDSQAE